MIVDPHTAVGVAASRAGERAWRNAYGRAVDGASRQVSRSRRARRGRVPEQPERLRLRLGQHERCAVLPNDYAAVADFITAMPALQGSTHKAQGRRAGVGA